MDYINDDLKALRAMFQERGFDIRIVGGAVRDTLMGSVPKDIDLCTDAFPDEQESIYSDNGLKHIPTGVQHGTWTVVMNDVPYEITSLRTETEHDGRHAKMNFTRNWLEDLSRRDLTINAMAMTFDGELLDPFNGAADLEARNVRFVGDARERMREDYLRILRYFRFLGRISQVGSVEVDADTAAALADRVEGLEMISAERIWSEVKRIVAADTGPEVYYYMIKHQVCQYAGLPRNTGAMANLKIMHGFTRNPVLLMCSLMHAPESAEALAKTLKWSSEERDLALMYFKLRDLNVNYRFHSVVVGGYNKHHVAAVTEAQGMPYIASLLAGDHPVFPVTGNDLIKAGVKPGPGMGEQLTSLKNRWFKSGCKLNKDQLLQFVV